MWSRNFHPVVNFICGKSPKHKGLVVIGHFFEKPVSVGLPQLLAKPGWRLHSRFPCLKANKRLFALSLAKPL
jgi:hypothetical protein